MSLCSSKTRIILVGSRGRHKKLLEEAVYGSHVEKLMKHVDIDEPTSFLDHVYLGCTQRECKPNENIVEEHTKMFESRISVGATWAGQTSRKNQLLGPTIWKGMRKKCVERYCEVANKKYRAVVKVSSPCLDDHQFKKEELESVNSTKYLLHASMTTTSKKKK